MVKIDIISGFLGAGKTSFIRRLLNTNLKKEKVVLIENEYGEVSVDTDILKDTKIEMRELSQGCICCSLVGDFSKALEELIERFNPDRVIIEPSGVGKLSDIINAVRKVGLSEAINSLVCLVDCKKAKMYERNFGEFFVDQIESAHTVVLSRTDIALTEKIEEAVEIVRKHNDKAVIITTYIYNLSDEELLKAYEGVNFDLLHEDEECHCHHHHHDEDDDEDEECCQHNHHDDDDDEDEECCHHHHHDHDEEECDDPDCDCHKHHHHHHADEVFTSVGIETVKKYDIKKLEVLLSDIASGKQGLIVRAKGIIEGFDNKWYLFNLTPEEYNIKENEPIPMGKIVVIGSKINEEEIKKLF